MVPLLTLTSPSRSDETGQKGPVPTVQQSCCGSPASPDVRGLAAQQRPRSRRRSVTQDGCRERRARCRVLRDELHLAAVQQGGGDGLLDGPGRVHAVGGVAGASSKVSTRPREAASTISKGRSVVRPVPASAAKRPECSVAVLVEEGFDGGPRRGVQLPGRCQSGFPAMDLRTGPCLVRAANSATIDATPATTNGPVRARRIGCRVRSSARR
jgi:hypothetical protein